MKPVWLLLGLFLISCAGDKTAPKEDNCRTVTEQSQCQFKVVGNHFCEWTKDSKCQRITQCSEITTRAACDSSPAKFLGCVWDLQANQCLKPDKQTCLSINNQSSCDQSPSCFWDTQDSSCQLVTACSQIQSDESKCDNFNGNSFACFWSNNSCIEVHHCSEVTEQSECDQHYYQSKSGTETCAWTPNAGPCVSITGCAELFQKAACQQATKYSCQWLNQKCEEIPDSCSGIKNQTDCEDRAKHPNIICQWANNSCELPPLNCHERTAQQVCELPGKPACSWESNICVNNPPIQCSDLVTEANCNTQNIYHGICAWVNKQCVEEQSCSAITEQAACDNASEGSTKVCGWTGTACKAKSCLNINNCSSFNSQNTCQGKDGCKWDIGISGGTCQFTITCPALKTESLCAEETNICRWGI